MATKPTKTPRWATSANRTVEPPESGASTTSKDVGWLNATRPPARFLNWVLNLTYQWILWLEDINNQSFTATGIGAWSKQHEFTSTESNKSAARFKGNGSGSGIEVQGGDSSGTGIYCEGGGGGFGINAFAQGSNQAGFFENGGDGAGIYALAGPDGTEDGGTFTGGGAGGVGSRSTGGGAGGHGALGIGTGDGIGFLGTGAGTGQGVYGTGGASNGDGVRGDGTGTGAGVRGVGGNTGGSGVLGVGGVSGATGGDFTGAGTGDGVRGAGGSSGGVGGRFSGGGATGHGIITTGGSTNGSGVVSTGVGSSGYGGSFSANAASLAINCGTGNMAFTGAQPAKAADPGFKNYLAGTNVCKAWAHITITGGVATLDDGYNIASLGLSTNVLTINFARAFANTNYAPNANTDFPSVCQCLITNASTMTFQSVRTPPGGSITQDTLTSVVNMHIYVQVFGRQ